MTLRVTILGCGSSEGVPTPAGNWGACNPADPRNRRGRASILVEAKDSVGNYKFLLIDTSPDLREQALVNRIRRIDGVLYTHAHADHLHGIDELRSFNRIQNEVIPAWSSAETAAAISRRFDYIVAPVTPGQSFYRPALDLQVVDGPFTAAGIAVTPVVQNHGFSQTLGFRIGRFAYSTDFVTLDDAALAALVGVDVWIVDCLRVNPPHPTHCHLEKTLEFVARVRPKRTILTHMDHETDYSDISALLPAGVEPGVDGMMIEI